MYNKLKKIQGFEEAFGTMMEQLKQGKVLAWDNAGVYSELTQEHKEHIAELNKRGYEVYAVLENYTVMFKTLMHMTSYLLLTKDCEDIGVYGPDTYYAFADVVNNTCKHMSEFGDVFIGSGVTGGPMRVA